MHGSGWGSAPPARVGPGSSTADLEAAAAFLESGGDPDVQPYGDGYGPEFEARYDSPCDASYCTQGGQIWEGDTIRADGDGGYVHTECADDF